MSIVDRLYQALDKVLVDTDFSELGSKVEGKVRDNYITSDGRRFIITTDRISVFDRVIGTLPLKGQVLQYVSNFWFQLTGDEVKNHFISVVDPNAVCVRQCSPLGAEMVVRAYLTGVSKTSIWTAYAAGAREFCGHRLPAGLKRHERLPQPLLTPSTKAEKGAHDVSMSRDELIALGAISAADFDEAAALALALFERGQRHCEKQGLILVDTKYEFGRDSDGQLRVIDEIHTPDSSRFWFADSYEQRMSQGLEPQSFDKEHVRRYLADRGFTGDGPIPEIPNELRVEAVGRYIAACERITGQSFEPDLQPPLPRLRQNLKLVS